MSTGYMRLVLAAVLTLSAVGVASAHDDEIYVGWAASEPLSELKSVNGYKCVDTYCPAGTFELDRNNNFIGCINLGILGCSGSCHECAGSTTTGYICVSVPNNTCDPGSASLPCGAIIYGDCDSTKGTPAPGGSACNCSRGSVPDPHATCAIRMCL
jgi:hypothetical protein